MYFIWSGGNLSKEHTKHDQKKKKQKKLKKHQIVPTQTEGKRQILFQFIFSIPFFSIKGGSKLQQKLIRRENKLLKKLSGQKRRKDSKCKTCSGNGVFKFSFTHCQLSL